ncbi:MAG: hypothetical protein ACK5PB_14040 [Pirellula sp.]|jgi:hypothetical protein
MECIKSNITIDLADSAIENIQGGSETEQNSSGMTEQASTLNSNSIKQISAPKYSDSPLKREEIASDGYCVHKPVKLDIKPEVPHKLQLQFLSRKPPLKPEAFELAGIKYATWYPRGLRSSWGVFGLPIYGHRNLSLCNWNIFPVTGSKHPATFDKSKRKMGNPVSGKVVYSKVSQDSPYDRNGVFLTLEDRELLTAGKLTPNLICIKVEGASDFLASVTEATPRNGKRFLIWSNSDGATSDRKVSPWFIPMLEALKPEECWVVHDADSAGQVGAGRWCRKLSDIAPTRNVLLPFEIVEKKGKDLRDFYVEGGTFEKLVAIAEGSELFDAKKYDEEIRNSRVIRNFKLERVKDANGVEEVKEVAESLPKIVQTIIKLNQGFPKRNAGELFTIDAGNYRSFRKHSQLFGWIRERFNVTWKTGPSFVSRDEFFDSLCHSSALESFDSVELYPHFPAMPRTYYVHQEIKEGSGEHLEKFLDYFSPATPMDRELLRAAIATTFWGGPLGHRPGFHFGSLQGQGSGKTTAVNLITKLTGGSIDFDQTAKRDEIMKRLLNGDSSCRSILLDNIKTNLFSSATIEALMTSTSLSGHRMYFGNCDRPNRYVLFVTFNSATFSRDMAQRLVSITLKQPERKPNWINEVQSFIENHHWDVIADVKRFFSLPTKEFPLYSRHAIWQKEILSRLEDPTTVAELLAFREQINDGDAESANTIQATVDSWLESYEYKPPYRVIVQLDTLAEMVSQAQGERFNGRSAAQLCDRLIGCGLLTRLQRNPSRKHGRSFLAISENSDSAETCKDLDLKIEKRKTEQVLELEKLKTEARRNA